MLHTRMAFLLLELSSLLVFEKDFVSGLPLSGRTTYITP